MVQLAITFSLFINGVVIANGLEQISLDNHLPFPSIQGHLRGTKTSAMNSTNDYWSRRRLTVYNEQQLKHAQDEKLKDQQRQQQQQHQHQHQIPNEENLEAHQKHYRQQPESSLRANVDRPSFPSDRASRTFVPDTPTRWDKDAIAAFFAADNFSKMQTDMVSQSLKALKEKSELIVDQFQEILKTRPELSPEVYKAVQSASNVLPVDYATHRAWVRYQEHPDIDWQVEYQTMLDRGKTADAEKFRAMYLDVESRVQRGDDDWLSHSYLEESTLTAKYYLYASLPDRLHVTRIAADQMVQIAESLNQYDHIEEIEAAKMHLNGMRLPAFDESLSDHVLALDSLELTLQQLNDIMDEMTHQESFISRSYSDNMDSLSNEWI
eukprot:GHVH01004381.1.p1 GENE.GHVH01004381.1~~GHVH01004381.1.p1  ORF type:complete len:380 (+),score=55.87 GHVH01004381.1:137-1276(+)